MTDRITRLKSYFMAKEHLAFRKEKPVDPSVYRRGEFHRRTALRLDLSLQMQDIVFIPDERFVATRTVGNLPNIYREGETASGAVNNICPRYDRVIAEGLEKTIERLESCKTPENAAYLESCILSCRAVMNFAGRYATAAAEQGKEEIVKNLRNIPRKGASTFYEALQFFRFLHFALWCEGDYHIVIGRFDQWMYPYLEADLKSGLLDEETALTLLEDFFLTFNKDTDLYPGVQLGDNGQSMMLGGYDLEGNDQYNLLSELCLKASLELRVIEPKLNMRVSKETPLERFELGSRLTAAGIGFPQYCNDDVVVKGLIELGYAPEDAVNYVVAACWEFIVPGKGMDVVNIDALSFPHCVDTVIRNTNAENFEEFLRQIQNEIKAQAAGLCCKHKRVRHSPAPLMSVLMDGCVEHGKDISDGGVYNNFGFHGVGLATAADSAIAVKRLVYEGKLEMEELIHILDSNFEGYEDLRYEMIHSFPKMGNNCDEVDFLAKSFLEAFVDGLQGYRNERGGIYRAGTGSAMLYYTLGESLGATPDGRKAGSFLPANYSPSLNVKLDGPFSIVQSFCKPDLSKTINGGPLTLELAATAIRGQIEKIALLVKSYVELGGHQLQLNVVNREHLLDAQKHPENYRNLVVRVWGWSGYFTELDQPYQDQIISRADLTV